MNIKKSCYFQEEYYNCGFILHYNIELDPMLGIGYIDVRWIPFRCYECLRKIYNQWNRWQDNHNQYWQKSENR